MLSLLSLRKFWDRHVFYCRDAGFDVVEGRTLGGFGTDVDLGVIGVTVEVQVEFAADVTKGE